VRGPGRSGVANLGPSPFGNPQLHVLMLPDFDRADRIGAYWATPRHPRGARRNPVLAATEAILSGRSR
jgi:hypothetical protein